MFIYVYWDALKNDIKRFGLFRAIKPSIHNCYIGFNILLPPIHFYWPKEKHIKEINQWLDDIRANRFV